ncbi:DNA polymerase subunit beta [Aquitalea sp. FJL05]|uniref:nucleotidyltransferase domain-containing protein n=1 Tax=Aquitalea TaxID=407217 RepID=UPI000F5B2790|nr:MULTISPECIES: nucleotidyltransferase domain-containing protein [Aquitalea]RQO78389.1 DNA polymerase subunit beta [Aquitalea sp. FJL05]
MDLLETLFGAQRQGVLARLLLHPEQSLHVRELARLTGSSPGSLHRELAKLAACGLLLRSTRGNQVLYQANVANPVYPELAGLFRKTVGLSTPLRDALQPLAGQIELALVFGSMARGEAHAESDIDVLVVGRVGFAEVVEALYPCQAMLGREINPVVYSTEKWQQMRAADDYFVRDVLTRPNLMLLGTIHDAG